MQHNAVVIAGEEQVAAGTDGQQFVAARQIGLQKVGQLLDGVVFSKVTCIHIHAESVVR